MNHIFYFELKNIQPLDFEQRAGFVNLGENMWYGGDKLGKILDVQKFFWASQNFLDVAVRKSDMPKSQALNSLDCGALLR